MASRWHLIEEKLLPIESVDQLADYRRRLLETYSRSQVAGCLDFLIGRSRGEDFTTNAASRSRYRKMLASLVMSPDRPPGDETGAAPIAVLATVTGIAGAAAAVATGHPAALLALAPIIPDSVNTENDELGAEEYRWEAPALLAA